MRVLLDTTFARRGPSGTEVYLRHLVPALRRAGAEVLPVADERRRPPAGGGPGSARNLARDLRWLHAELPAAARRLQVDVVHHPLPAWSPAIGVPQVVTVHDVAFERLPHAFDPRFRAWARVAHRFAADRAAAVVCVSEATALDVRALWGVPEAKVVVARHGPGQEPDNAFAGARTATHVLYVGDDEPRKNLGLLVDAHRRYRERGGTLPLQLVGGAGGGPLEPQALARHYAECAVLVHPSLHEGFGLTVLEAMSAGAPVVAVRSAAVEEVGGDAVRYVPADDPDRLAAVLLELERDPAQRADMGERGRRRAAEFSWARSARAHLSAYAAALR